VSARSKEAGLELENVKTLPRHEEIATTSNVYGDLGDEGQVANSANDGRIRQAASLRGSLKQEAAWQEKTPVTIQRLYEII
jgi:hypothetical protein